MANVKNIIAGHNKKVLNSANNKESIAPCNCKKYPCPMEGNCDIDQIVYRTNIVNNGTNGHVKEEKK